MKPDLPILPLETVLSLTREEAFALLEMCAFTTATEHPTHLRVLDRLGRLCRELLSVSPESEQSLIEEYVLFPSPGRSREQLTVACLS